MDVHPHTADCFTPRLAQAGRHVDRGEWACGHAIVERLLKCASHSERCPRRDDCRFAAELLLGDIRRMLTAA
ncbi:MAG: hypothetical protein ACM33T_11255 [Solirubrobacterales bacterium]